MFTQRSVSGRVLDSLAGPITRPWHVGAMTAALIPLVFVLQLLVTVLLFAVGDRSLVVLLAVVVVTEELAKSLHIYAAYERGRFERAPLVALALGAVSGTGFFLAEKTALVAQLAGLPELPTGQTGLLGGVFAGPAVLLLLLAPLALHVVTAAISALGASQNRRRYLAAVLVAMAVHLAYNIAVVILFV